MKCCVPKCENDIKSTKLYVLPKDKERRKKWCIAICRLDLIEIEAKKRQNSRVCEDHFARDAKYEITVRNKTNLKYGAYPTLQLPVTKMPKIEDNLVDPEPRTSGDYHKEYSNENAKN
ncbi:unnamed protein product [Xylocopa violacea]